MQYFNIILSTPGEISFVRTDRVRRPIVFHEVDHCHSGTYSHGGPMEIANRETLLTCGTLADHYATLGYGDLTPWNDSTEPLHMLRAFVLECRAGSRSLYVRSDVAEGSNEAGELIRSLADYPMLDEQRAAEIETERETECLSEFIREELFRGLDEEETAEQINEDWPDWLPAFLQYHGAEPDQLPSTNYPWALSYLEDIPDSTLDLILPAFFESVGEWPQFEHGAEYSYLLDPILWNERFMAWLAAGRAVGLSHAAELAGQLSLEI